MRYVARFLLHSKSTLVEASSLQHEDSNEDGTQNWGIPTCTDLMLCRECALAPGGRRSLHSLGQGELSDFVNCFSQARWLLFVTLVIHLGYLYHPYFQLECLYNPYIPLGYLRHSYLQFDIFRTRVPLLYLYQPYLPLWYLHQLILRMRDLHQPIISLRYRHCPSLQFRDFSLPCPHIHL